jgi:hypothetical protein
MSKEQIIFETLKIVLAIAAATFAYFRFFREGEHKQRIQFDIDCKELGVTSSEKIIEIGSNAENKGNVEQRFDDIRVVLRGLEEGKPLSELEEYKPRLAFPVPLAKASLIPKKWGYFFVRPHVSQRFPLVLRIPRNISHILVRCTFQYQGTDDVHSAERAFDLGSGRQNK